jgi:hypothetical protein
MFDSNHSAGQTVDWHSRSSYWIMETIAKPEGAEPRAACGRGGHHWILGPCRMYGFDYGYFT